MKASRSFAADGDAVYRFSAWLKDARVLDAFADEPRTLIEITLVEAFTNIVRHGLKEDPKQTLEVAADGDAGSLSITFIDPGPEYDPTTATPKERRGDEAHGMGLKFLAEIPHSRTYERREGANRLTLRFRI